MDEKYRWSFLTHNVCVLCGLEAFESISHDKLWVTMHLIDLLAKLYMKQLAKVKVVGTLSEWFGVKKGVRQGCILSPYCLTFQRRWWWERPSMDCKVDYKLEGDWSLTFATLMTSSCLEAELQKLVDLLDWVSRKYSLLTNVDKTKVMASDGIACRILTQNEQLEQMDTLNPYVGSLITEDGECTTEFRTRLNKEQVIGASLQKVWKSYSIPISTKIGLMKALV